MLAFCYLSAGIHYLFVDKFYNSANRVVPGYSLTYYFFIIHIVITILYYGMLLAFNYVGVNLFNNRRDVTNENIT